MPDKIIPKKLKWKPVATLWCLWKDWRGNIFTKLH